MSIIVGSLAGQNWHRQMRRLNLDQTRRLDFVIDKTAAIGKEFGFSPMGIDLPVPALPSLDRSYIEEFKARLADNNLTPVMYVGGVVLSYDEEVRHGALNTGFQHLEVAAHLGIHTCGFGCGIWPSPTACSWGSCCTPPRGCSSVRPGVAPGTPP